MSNEVDLKLVADAKPYVDSVKQAMNANQQLYAQVKQNLEFEKRNIDDIKAAIYQYSEAKKKATNPKEQERYNAKIAEAKLHLNEAKLNAERYAKEQKKLGQELQNSEKSQGIFSTGLAKLVGVVGGAVGAWNLFKKAMNSLDSTGDKMRMTFEGIGFATQSLMRDLVALNFEGIIRRMQEANEAGNNYAKNLIDIEHRERSLMIMRMKMQEDITQAEIDMREALMKIQSDYSDENVKAYEEAQKRFTDINEEIIKANEKTSGMRLENFRQNVLKIKGGTEQLTEDQIKVLEDYVIDYAELADKEIANVNKVKEARELANQTFNDLEKKRAQRAGRSQGADASFTESEIKQINDVREAVKEQMNTLTEKEKKIYELDESINKFIGTERDEFAKLVMAYQANVNQFTQMQKSIIRQQLQYERAKIAAGEKAKAEELANIKKLGDEILKLEDENEKKRIERLEGSQRFEAEEEYQLKQIAKTKAFLETLGTLDANALQAIATMEQNVRNERAQKEQAHEMERVQSLQDRADQELEIAKKKNDELKKLDSDIADYQRQVELSMADYVDKTGLQRMIVARNHKQAEVDALKALYLEQVMAADEASKKLAQITMAQIELGNDEVQSLDEQIRQKKLKLSDYAQAFQTAFNTVTGMLQSTYNAQLQFFQRERQMMDTRIGELQRTIDQEIEARDKGYANNVEGKKKELEKLQAERDKAFEKEKKVAEAQRKLNEVIQVSNLITASAQIFNTYSLIPGGTLVAISLIALMLGAYVKAKVDAKKYASLGEGGTGTKTGIVTGRKHSQGGENFLDHVEIETDEHWGVLAANRVPKYGKAFHGMIKAMNEGRLELRPNFRLPQSNNTVIVNNDNKRMQSLESAMRDVERAIKDQPQIYYSGGKRIEKKGRNTRIIYEKN